MFSILPYSFVFGLYFLIFGVQNMHLVSSPTRTVFAGCTNKSKKTSKQSNKQKQTVYLHCRSASVLSTDCISITGPHLLKSRPYRRGKDLVWKLFAQLFQLSWKEIRSLQKAEQANKRKNEKINKQRPRDWGTEGRGNVRKGEETRWQANGYMDGQTGNRRTNQGGRGQRVGVTDGRTNAQK